MSKRELHTLEKGYVALKNKYDELQEKYDKLYEENQRIHEKYGWASDVAKQFER